MQLFHKIALLKNKVSIQKLLFVCAALFLFYHIPKTYLESSPPICIYKNIFHKDCIGCGTTRAVWSVLHLEINDAIAYNKLIVISFPLMAGCALSWVRKRKKGKKTFNKSKA